MIQPSDETPLAPAAWTPAIPTVAQSIPGIAAEITAGRAGVVEAARAIADEIATRLTAARSGVISGALEQAHGIATELATDYSR